jgi:two-component system phosphate regulon response regulator PhoB
MVIFMTNEKTNNSDRESNPTPRITEEEIENLDIEDENVKELMEQYHEETEKFAIWRGVVTEGFKRWLRRETIYDRDKERISLYVSDDTKSEWQNFINMNKEEYTTISKLIRKSVEYFINIQSKFSTENPLKLDNQAITNISHALKEPLTSIKGFSQLLLENYKDELDEHVLTTVQKIFEQSILLENKIINILDNMKTESNQYDILLIEDDLATIRLLTSYFESKGYSCQGVVSGKKGFEELNNNIPKVILLDIILPDYSGYEICKTIKLNKDYKNIPVYLLTAIPGSEVKNHMEDIHADGYILKPFDFSDFETIFKYLK